VLEALSRFGREGEALPFLRLPFLRRLKPARKLLYAVADRMTRLGMRSVPGVVLEFGVYRGQSLRRLARLFPECRLYGFDTFSGFPPDGREDWQLDFATHALPRVPERVELVVGRFEETLAPFLERKGTFPLRMVHVDCDIFSAARTALFGLGERLGPGSVIVFDELLNYGEFADNELLALYLFLTARGLSFEWFVTVGEVWPFEKACAGEHPAGAFCGYRDRCCYQNAAVVLTAGTADARLGPFIAAAARLAQQRPPRQTKNPGTLSSPGFSV
jgi:hypothetical protein